MKNINLKKIIIVLLIVIVSTTVGFVSLYVNQSRKEAEETTKPDKNIIKNDNDKLDTKDDSKNNVKDDLENDSENDSKEENEIEVSQDVSNDLSNEKVTDKPLINNNPGVSNQPVVPEKPSVPEKPVLPEQPEEPEQPEKPSEDIIEDLLITNNMIEDGTYKVENKKYKTVTIESNIQENAKIVLNNLEIKERLVLVKPGKYQLDIVNTTMPTMLVADNPIEMFSLFTRMLGKKNVLLEGATVNLENGSTVESILINSNVEINGDNNVSNIDINTAKEVVLNIPSKNLSINTDGVVSVNKNVDMLENRGHKSEININAQVTTLTNTKSSTIRISESNTITNFNNQGENTVVSGNGTITNTKISANNTVIYTDVTNRVEANDNIDYLIRKESNISILKAESKKQGSVTFTLSEAVELALNDISVICNAGKSLSLFNLTTKDNITYTLTTSYYKNNSYGLYITLPNGNIVSKDFGTDYANPTVTDVVLERNSGTEATLKLYGVDEGGDIYYIIEDATTREVINASNIKQHGKTQRVKVGFNSISIKDLEPEKSYNLYYVIEGFFNNLSDVKGPFEITSQVKDVNQSKYEIVYAKEEISNRFVFKLNRIPEKELTLKDFEIVCPSDSSLTIKDATFYVSPDLLTYIIVIPDNYGHKDNEYTIKIQVSENEKIEKDFVTHMNPPVITGAVDGVIRDSETTAQFKFNSDEPGEVYYGIYEWNGGIYDYNSTTPFASDVITGKIVSRKQKLNAGANVINLDLSNIEVTRYTRVWALFIDEVGNYRVGFVDHYKIPEFVNPDLPNPDSTLEITNFKFTNNNFFEIEFNEELLYDITSDDVKVSVAGEGSLPNKLLFIINNSTPKKVTIKIQNYTLPTGEYNLTLTATDKNNKTVKLVRTVKVN